MPENPSWGIREYDIWKDDSSAAKAMRKQMPHLLSDDELAKRSVKPAMPYISQISEPDLPAATQTVTDNIIGLLDNAQLAVKADHHTAGLQNMISD